MEILSPQEFTSATQLDKIKWGFIAPFLMRTMKIRELNDLYKKTCALEGIPFIDAVLKHLSISYEVTPEELKHIPAKGAFIAVANHPYGGLDGILLLKLLATARPDSKILANEFLMKLPNVNSYLIPVDPFKPSQSKNVPGLRMVLEQLHNDMPLGIFPSGEVSSFDLMSNKITDPEWKASVGRLIDIAKVPVVPVHFSGSNSWSFNLLGVIHPFLRTARLPAELFNKQDLNVKIRIGKPVPYTELRQLPANDRLPYLRARTYAMQNRSGNNSWLTGLFQPGLFQKEIISEIHPTLIEAELNALRPTGKLFSHEQFDVFLARQHEVPNVVREIGRLREITFRQVGEGTNQETDLDWYDQHYHHLFVFDRSARLLVGAYRIGKGREIYQKFGKKGFYLHSLFKIKEEFVPVLKQSLELGRSFIRPEYQKKPLPLLLLWKGISTYLEGKLSYQYLIGPVSISNYFSSFSKALMVDFILDNFYDRKLAQYILPRKKFRYRLSEQTARTILRKSLQSITSLDDLIAHIEPGQNGLPVLLKKYLKQNARIIGFNIDPKFSNALDGFMIMDVKDLPNATHQMLERLNKTL